MVRKIFAKIWTPIKKYYPASMNKISEKKIETLSFSKLNKKKWIFKIPKKDQMREFNERKCEQNWRKKMKFFVYFSEKKKKL